MYNDLISTHIFLFPFKWEIKKGEKATLSEKTQLKEIEQKVDKNNWDTFAFKFRISDSGQYNSYNEFSYFHSYVRDILSLDNDGSITKRHYSFSLKKKKQLIATKATTEEAKEIENSIVEYQIFIKDDANPLVLQIEDITLNLYENGIGVLSLHLNNYTIKDFARVLKINEYGRRIYPQFLGSTAKSFTSDTKYNFLPDKIVIAGQTTEPIVENFSHYDSLEHIQHQPFILPAHLKFLLGDSFKTNYESLQPGDAVIEPLIDDRMFVMSYFINTELILKFRAFENGAYHWQDAVEWLRYLYVDDSTPSCHSRLMTRKLLEESTNDRWIENKEINKEGVEKETRGQLFGISRYSFVILGADCWFNRNILLYHFKYLYFQMTLLALVQRASVLSFSNEASEISQEISSGNNRKVIRRISDLYLLYIKFINKVYFREITPQEQGIELYNLLHNRMGVREEVAQLDAEIKELNDFVQLEEQQKLGRIAALWLPASLILAFFGLNYFGPNGGENLLMWGNSANNLSAASAIVIVLICGLATLISWLVFVRKK